MLSCVPPSKEAIENMKRSTYCGASSGYKPAKVITENGITVNGIESMRWSRIGESNDDFYVGSLGDGIATKVTQCEKPTIAVTYNHDISTWDTDADIVLDKSLNQVYYLDKAGCVTEDKSQAKSITWAEIKNGDRVVFQQPYDASQAYQKNDLVEKDGWIYQSRIEDNVWAPDLIESRMSELWTEIARLKAEEKIHSQLIDTINKGHLPPIHRYDWWER